MKEKQKREKTVEVALIENSCPFRFFLFFTYNYSDINITSVKGDTKRDSRDSKTAGEAGY